MTDKNTPGAVRLEVEVAPETADDIRKLLAERGWDSAEGLRILFGAGIGALKALALEDGYSDESESERMLRHAAENEQALALLRFRLYETQKANEAWDLSTGAIHNQNAGYKAIIDRQIGELAELKRQLGESKLRIRHLEGMLDHLDSTRTVNPESQPSSPRWRRWLGALLGK